MCDVAGLVDVVSLIPPSVETFCVMGSVVVIPAEKIKHKKNQCVLYSIRIRI